MVTNVGDTERMLRILIGLLFIGLAFALAPGEDGIKGWWFGLLGVIPVFTGVLGWCPVYLPFKISTNT